MVWECEEGGFGGGGEAYLKLKFVERAAEAGSLKFVEVGFCKSRFTKVVRSSAENQYLAAQHIRIR